MKPTEILELFTSIVKASPDYDQEFDGELPDDVKPIVLEFAAALEAKWREELRVDADPVAWMYSEKGGRGWPSANNPNSFAPNELSENEVSYAPLYPSSAIIAARQAGRDEQREIDAKICEAQMRHLDGIDSLGAGASRGWMNNCAEAIRNQQPSEGEK